MRFMNKILALIAGVHTNNSNAYLAVRSLLLFPYQSIVAQQNYLLIKKSEFN
jgi:CRISPR/Cas system-associated endonuclease/helicase Cas3